MWHFRETDSGGEAFVRRYLEVHGASLLQLIYCGCHGGGRRRNLVIFCPGGFRRTASVRRVHRFVSSGGLTFICVSQAGYNIYRTIQPRIRRVLRRFPTVGTVRTGTSSVPRITNRFAIFAIPTLLLFIRNGRVVHRTHFIIVSRLRRRFRQVASGF